MSRPRDADIPAAAAAPVRLVVVEDEPLFRELVVGGLASRDDVVVVGAFATVSEALVRVPALRPDAALLDLQLGDGRTGVELGLQLRRQLPDLGIVLLSAHADPEVLTALPATEADGWSYLLKHSVGDLQTVVDAVHGAIRGQLCLDPQLTAARSARRNGRLQALTERQREILRLLAEGRSNAAIAQRLVLAQKSVENHVNGLYQRLGLDSGDRDIAPRVAATRIYLDETAH